MPVRVTGADPARRLEISRLRLWGRSLKKHAPPTRTSPKEPTREHCQTDESLLNKLKSTRHNEARKKRAIRFRAPHPRPGEEISTPPQMASTALTSAAEAATTTVATAARRVRKQGVSVATGVVVSAGLCAKTVKVRVGGEQWNDKVKKVPYHTRFRATPSQLSQSP